MHVLILGSGVMNKLINVNDFLHCVVLFPFSSVHVPA
jgi:hypothetical protein